MPYMLSASWKCSDQPRKEQWVRTSSTGEGDCRQAWGPECDPGTHCSKLSSTYIPLRVSACTNTYKPNVKNRRGRKVSGTLASVPKAGSQQGKEKGQVPVVAIETGFRVFVAGGHWNPECYKAQQSLQNTHIREWLNNIRLRDEQRTLDLHCTLILYEAKIFD